MKVIDIINPSPIQGADLFWIERLASEHVMKYGKRIEVKYTPKISDEDCPPDSRGRRDCEAQGSHTWFNHAMDKAY